ncbi:MULTISPECIES: DUF3068 domain-containing protein [unclassified Corynebacterium]|uniref:DUF3068 domain-containing protein n=1 Tax=unclassified Corynebacterium TaxID=2624378 RepID=UPI0030ABA3E6
MLPRSRIASVLILGLGAALIAIGVLLPRLLSDDPKLPLDLPPTSYVMRSAEGVSSKIAEDGSREEVTSPIRRQLHGELIQPADKERVSLRVGTSVIREMDAEVVGTADITELIDAQVWTFSIDRLSGKFQGPATIVDRMAGVPRQVPVDGYWVKFPAGTEEKTYPVFDDFLRESVPADFKGKDTRNGEEVLHFTQKIDKTNVATHYRGNNTHISIDGKDGFLTYEGTRDWYVEPRSGLVVDVAEDINLWWETRDGEKLMTYLDFTGKMEESETAWLLAGARHVYSTTPLRPWSIALITIGAILAFAGTVGAVRPERRKAGDEPTPVEPEEKKFTLDPVQDDQ